MRSPGSWRCRRSGSAPAPEPPARSSSSTTCSGSPPATWRNSSSATPTSTRRWWRPLRSTGRRSAAATFPTRPPSTAPGRPSSTSSAATSARRAWPAPRAGSGSRCPERLPPAPSQRTTSALPVALAGDDYPEGHRVERDPDHPAAVVPPLGFRAPFVEDPADDDVEALPVAVGNPVADAAAVVGTRVFGEDERLVGSGLDRKLHSRNRRDRHGPSECEHGEGYGDERLDLQERLPFEWVDETEAVTAEWYVSRDREKKSPVKCLSTSSSARGAGPGSRSWSRQGPRWPARNAVRCGFGGSSRRWRRRGGSRGGRRCARANRGGASARRRGRTG